MWGGKFKNVNTSALGEGCSSRRPQSRLIEDKTLKTLAMELFGMTDPAYIYNSLLNIQDE